MTEEVLRPSTASRSGAPSLDLDQTQGQQPGPASRPTQPAGYASGSDGYEPGAFDNDQLSANESFRESVDEIFSD